MNRLLMPVLGFLVVVCISAVLGVLLYKGLTQKTQSSHALTVEKIEQMGRLELVRISVKDVVKQTKERPIYLPNAKALLIVFGEVYAGIDLAKVKKEDFLDSDTQITITLPKPEILVSKINHQETEIYDVTAGYWNTVDLIGDGFKAAESKIRLAAMKIGFEEQCKTQAIALLTPLFSELARKTVILQFKK